jgi:hypothetical protein
MDGRPYSGHLVKAAKPAAAAIARADAVARELDWLEAVMTARFDAYGAALAEPSAPRNPLPRPPAIDEHVPYHALIRDLGLGADARLVVALALAPYVAPERLDPFLLQNQATGRRFTEFGGLIGQSHAGFLPTAETAMFLLSHDDRSRRVAHEGLFSSDHPLVRRGLLVLDHKTPDEPPLSAALRLSGRGLNLLINGEAGPPQPGADFPATPITTPLDWGDLILDAPTQMQIDMIGLWLRHSQTLLQDWGLARRLKPGYRCLFYGPPGTGKTLTACLLGKRHHLPVYRVDLSRVVSKWIGETEKNLAALFDEAEDSGWILFFDEADALFGKRTDSNSANDRAANQQIAYLLQRLETYSGLAILATNQHAFLDEAFARRFQAAIRFPMPDAAARLRLWRETFASEGFTLAADVDLEELAERHELSGGAIINVLRHACLMAVQRRPPKVHAHDLTEGARLEMQKDGRYLSR